LIFGNWCWCFWSVEVEVLDLLGAKEITIRAWDQSLNTQPEKLIWNLMVLRLITMLASSIDSVTTPATPTTSTSTPAPTALRS
jgi:hypothetical protein